MIQRIKMTGEMVRRIEASMEVFDMGCNRGHLQHMDALEPD